MWSLRPAGVQVDLADFPVNIALHPDGKLDDLAVPDTKGPSLPKQPE